MNKASQTITITKDALKDGVVIMDLKSYRKMLKSAVPEIQLYGKEAEELDKLVEEGLKEYHTGKTKEIKSSRDLD